MAPEVARQPLGILRTLILTLKTMRGMMKRPDKKKLKPDIATLEYIVDKDCCEYKYGYNKACGDWEKWLKYCSHKWVKKPLTVEDAETFTYRLIDVCKFCGKTKNGKNDLSDITSEKH